MDESKSRIVIFFVVVFVFLPFSVLLGVGIKKMMNTSFQNNLYNVANRNLPTKETEDDMWSMTPEDCFPEEKYDPVEKVCYFECDTDEECEQIEAAIEARIGEIEDDFYNGDNQVEELNSEDGTAITTYSVVGSTLSTPVNETVTGELLEIQNDTQKHEEVWSYFARLIPEDFRTEVTGYEIFTDGKDGTLAAVAPHEQDPKTWTLYIDIKDAYTGDTMNTTDLTYTLIHEFGHILTLNSTQVEPDTELHLAESDEEYATLLKQKEDTCSPAYFTGEGCSKTGSYINQFVTTFWNTILAEFNAIQSIDDEDEYYEVFDEFYQRYLDQFVTDYAATNPGEDIAESWTAFVLKDKPIGNTVADQKITFFYNYPELERLRNTIRSRI